MKNNFKFLSIVLVILLASSVVLTGCMYAIAAEHGDAKAYDMGSQISSGSNIIVGEEDSPTSQAELQKKFSAMYDISEDGKSITVISEEYLKEFWQSNYEKEVIHSLTTEEVYFIIQDSIRIYEQYDEVVLTGFASVSSTKQVAERFPLVDDKVIKTQPNETPYYDWDDIDAIYEIIMYRLKALSSPKAFFTGEEAMRFAGEEPGINSTMLPWTMFYIPCYSESTNRDYVLFVVGYSQKMNSVVDVDEFSDLFGFCNKNGASIFYRSKTNEQSVDIFPTDEIYKFPVSDGLDDTTNNPNSDVTSEVDEKSIPHFKIDIAGGKCSLVSSDGSKVEAEGTCIQEGNVYILYFDGDFQYLFYYIEGVGYEYGKAESNPIPGYEFENKSVFTLNDNLLKPTEK